MMRARPLAGQRISDRMIFVQFILLWLALGALQLYELDKRPPTKSEVDSILLVRSEMAETLAACGEQHEAPLFALACSLFKMQSLPQVFEARLLSVVFGWLTFLGAWLLVRRTAPRANYAVIFAVLMATSPFWIEMSRMANGQSLFACCAIFSTLLIFDCLEAPRLDRWLAYIIFATATMYAGILGITVIAGHAAAGIFRKHWTPSHKTYGRLLVMFISIAIVLAASLPCLPIYLGKINESITNHINTAGRIRYALVSTLYAIYMWMVGDSIPPWNALRSVMFIQPALLDGAFGLVRILEHHHRSLRSVFICAFTAFIAAMAILTFLLRSNATLETPMQLAFIYPFFALTAAYGLGVTNRWLAIPLLAVLLAIHGVSLRNYYQQREYTNWAYAIPVEDTLTAIREREDAEGLLVLDESVLGHFDRLYQGPMNVWLITESAEGIDRLTQDVSQYARVIFLRPEGIRAYDDLEDDLLKEFSRKERLSFLREDAVTNELKMFFTGKAVPVDKYSLEVYERKP